MKNLWADLSDVKLLDMIHGDGDRTVEEEILRRLTGLRQALENVRTALNWRG